MKWPMCSELPIFISSLLSQILPRQVLFAELCCGQQKLLGGLICLTKRKEKETLWVREVGGILVFCFHSPLFFFFSSWPCLEDTPQTWIVDSLLLFIPLFSHCFVGFQRHPIQVELHEGSRSSWNSKNTPIFPSRGLEKEVLWAGEYGDNPRKKRLEKEVLSLCVWLLQGLGWPLSCDKYTDYEQHNKSFENWTDMWTTTHRKWGRTFDLNPTRLVSYKTTKSIYREL